MATTPPAVPLEALLVHRAWVRRVARALVSRETDAEDLEQEVWLLALESRPREEASARGWLRTVLRRTARDLWRSESRRRRREESVPAPLPGTSTADLVAEAESHRRVVDAVMDLDEVYRTVILLRYFHDIPPTAIARQEGIPLETVRTRLRRAREALRQRFDARGGGDRGAWVLALAPLVRPGTAAGTGVAAGGSILPWAAAGLLAASAVAAGVVLLGAGVRGVPPVPPAIQGGAGEVEDGERAVVGGPAAGDIEVPGGTVTFGAVESEPGGPSEAAADPWARDLPDRGPVPSRLPAGRGAGVRDRMAEAFAVVSDPRDADPVHLHRAMDLLGEVLATGGLRRDRAGQCHAGLGRCLFRLGRLEEAEGEFEEALRIGETGRWSRGWANLRLGNIADIRGRRDEALRRYRAVLDAPWRPNLEPQKERARAFLDRPYLGYPVDG